MLLLTRGFCISRNQKTMMKAKNQPQFPNEIDPKELLIVYVCEYLIHAGAKQAADTFKETINYKKEIKLDESPGFLAKWWDIFWDLYNATPERRHLQVESSSDARAFHDFTRSTPMSPSMAQTSPIQQPPQPQFIPTICPPRYPPLGHPSQALRGPPPTRMQAQLQHGPPPGSYMPAGNPRYAQHQGPSHLPQHQAQLGFGPPPSNQMGSSPGAISRMTPLGGQQQLIGQPGITGLQQQTPSQMIGTASSQTASPVNSMQCATGPPRNGSQVSVGGWTPTQVSYANVSSPTQQSVYSNGPGSNQPTSQGGSTSGPIMMNDGNLIEVKGSPTLMGADPSNPHSEDYVVPVTFGQDTSDQDESAEILRLKQSIQEDATKMFEKEQSEFNLDYSDSQNKW